MNMVNKANKTVQPSSASTQSAIKDFVGDFNQKGFLIDIYDANGTASWPMAYLTYISVGRNVTMPDCTPIYELFSFFAWTLTNDG